MKPDRAKEYARLSRGYDQAARGSPLHVARQSKDARLLLRRANLLWRSLSRGERNQAFLRLGEERP